MAASLLGGDEDVAGTMTSGGTESIMMAIKTAREWGRKVKGLQRPHVIVPASAPPAFDKAMPYFDLDHSPAAPLVDLPDLLRDRHQRSCPDPRRHGHGGGLLGHARQA